MVQGQVFLKGEVEGGVHFSYLVFSRFIIFTFRNYKGISCIMYPTSGNISSRRLMSSIADNDFFTCQNSRVNKCLCCQSDVWCVLRQMMTLINYFTLCKIVLCI